LILSDYQSLHLYYPFNTKIHFVNTFFIDSEFFIFAKLQPINVSVFQNTIIRKACPHILHRVVVWDKVKERGIARPSNHLEFGAATIPAIYKARRQIQLFLKALKQTIKVRTFVKTTENALYIQTLTALIAILFAK
jgi:IS4 transposase